MPTPHRPPMPSAILQLCVLATLTVGLAVHADPFRKEPYLVFPGDPTQMKVLWQLVATDSSTIEWGTDSTYASGRARTAEYGIDHQHAMTLGDLTPGEHYLYRVTAQGVGHGGSFNAAPAPSTTRAAFLAYGDTRSFPAVHDQVAAAMIGAWNANPELQSFALVVGDLVNAGNLEADWTNQFFSPAYANIREFLAKVPYQSCMGNHEGTGALFVKYFSYPFVAGRYWSFDYGVAHFVIVDQYTSYAPGSAQLQWIASDLASSTKPWKFICLHEPGWSAGGNHPNNTSVQNYIQPLCEQFGVTIVFGGHNHYYARAIVNGVHHVTTGGGGAPLYTPNPAYPNVVASARDYNFCTVQIDDYRLAFRALNPNGALIDSFSVASVVEVTCSGIAAEPGPGWVDLRWSAALEVPATLRVMRASRAEDTFEPVSADLAGEPGRSDFSWRDHTVRPSTEYWYRIGWREIGEWNYSAAVRTVTQPAAFGFRGITPNPAGRGMSRFTFELAHNGRARLDIYDATGKRMHTLADGAFAAGLSSVTWDCREDGGKLVPAGVYFAKLASGERFAVRKLVVTH